MDVLSFNTIAEKVKREINHKCGLNLSQTRILLFFNNNNEPLSMGALAKKLNISLSTLSRQLQQKKTRTFIKIIRSDSNSSKSVCLNEAGLNKLNELKKALNEIENEMFIQISDNEVNLFKKELEILTKSLNQKEK